MVWLQFGLLSFSQTLQQFSLNNKMFRNEAKKCFFNKPWVQNIGTGWWRFREDGCGGLGKV